MDSPVVKFIVAHPKSIALVVGVTALASLKLKSIYVPECIDEGRASYKSGIFMTSMLKKLARLANKFRLGNEATVFRYLYHKLVDMAMKGNRAILNERYKNIQVVFKRLYNTI